MSEATLGPWRSGVDWTGGYRPLEGEREMEVACIPSFGYDAIDIFGPENLDDDPRPIANLIASAPELLRCLQQLHDDIAEYAKINNLGGFDNHAMRQARAAIASATGATA